MDVMKGATRVDSKETCSAQLTAGSLVVCWAGSMVRRTADCWGANSAVLMVVLMVVLKDATTAACLVDRKGRVKVDHWAWLWAAPMVDKRAELMVDTTVVDSVWTKAD
jgi:hypothetical protein